MPFIGLGLASVIWRHRLVESEGFELKKNQNPKYEIKDLTSIDFSCAIDEKGRK